jgi:hypothetical protein
LLFEDVAPATLESASEEMMSAPRSARVFLLKCDSSPWFLVGFNRSKPALPEVDAGVPEGEVVVTRR